MKYTIHDQTEETMCDWCGRPLYAGDTVYTDEPESQVFCAPQDQRAWIREYHNSPDYGYVAREYIVNA